jgi:hypothetical protein
MMVSFLPLSVPEIFTSQFQGMWTSVPYQSRTAGFADLNSKEQGLPSGYVKIAIENDHL